MVDVGAGVVIDEVAGQNAVDQDREFAGGGGKSFGLADAHRQAAVKRPEGGGSFPYAHRAAAQDDRGAIGGGWGAGAEQATAGDLIVWCQRQPGSEMLFGWPAGHVGADLTDQVQRRLRAEGIDLAQVDATGEPMQGAADIELGLMLGSPPAPRRRQWCRRWRLP